jgi:hypothetical protein
MAQCFEHDGKIVLVMDKTEAALVYVGAGRTRRMARMLDPLSKSLDSVYKGMESVMDLNEYNKEVYLARTGVVWTSYVKGAEE